MSGHARFVCIDLKPTRREMFHRYECATCHTWVHYDEWTGRWWHDRDYQVVKVWNGKSWELEA